jgi:hypothetical protein
MSGYPSIGVEFGYDEHGALISVIHTVEIDDDLHARDAISESDTRLRTLWAELEFLRGSSLPRRAHEAHRSLPQTPTAAGVGFHVQLSATASVLVVNPIRMPAEAAAASGDPRLRVWLERANGARDEDDPAHALRDYHAILEEMGLVPPDVKHARDFVSHGGPLRNSDLLKLVRGPRASRCGSVRDTPERERAREDGEPEKRGRTE